MRASAVFFLTTWDKFIEILNSKLKIRENFYIYVFSAFSGPVRQLALTFSNLQWGNDSTMVQIKHTQICCMSVRSDVSRGRQTWDKLKVIYIESPAVFVPHSLSSKWLR